MTLFITLLTIFLTTLFVLIPVRRELLKREYEQFLIEFRKLQLETIRRRYVSLQTMKPAEIEERFDVDRVYSRMR